MWFVLGLGVAQGQTVIVGGNWGNADLAPADTDVLEGVFEDVATFHVDLGTTVYVQRDVQLEVYADEIVIDGILDGAGGGRDGGNGAQPGPGGNTGLQGVGPGSGSGGLPGPCVHGGGGGGGGYGGPGGNGSYYFQGQGQGGGVYGDPEDPTQLFLGSGGGGGGAGCDFAAGNGGRGGAGIVLVARIITIDGDVLANGGQGGDAPQWQGGGGGGSGGTILIDGGSVNGIGNVMARGGNGGTVTQNAGGFPGGGGGGGGGRVFVLYGSLSPDLILSAPGGQKGQDIPGLMPPYMNPGANGMPGTTFTLLTDPDVDDDGIDVSIDNCPDIPNPDQADRDDDGIGDACDACPDDPVDADGDGVCDSVDQCPGGDDNADLDGDTQPDACDCGPEDPLAQTGAIEACDNADNDCNGLVDEPGAAGESDFFADLDGDGFGDPNQVRHACLAPLNFIPDGTDCNDASPVAHPEGDEVCDGIDNDCDGQIDPSCAADTAEAEGCGCASTPEGPAALMALGLAMVIARRRAR